MKTTLFALILTCCAYAQQNINKANLKPIAAGPPGTVKAQVLTPVPEVQYWKLLKLASDEEATRLRQALINADRNVILTEICHSAGIYDISTCQISPDAKTVSKMASPKP